jgi:hypothetical protein
MFPQERPPRPYPKRIVGAKSPKLHQHTLRLLLVRQSTLDETGTARALDFQRHLSTSQRLDRHLQGLVWSPSASGTFFIFVSKVNCQHVTVGSPARRKSNQPERNATSTQSSWCFYRAQRSPQNPNRDCPLYGFVNRRQAIGARPAAGMPAKIGTDHGQSRLQPAHDRGHTTAI